MTSYSAYREDIGLHLRSTDGEEYKSKYSAIETENVEKEVVIEDCSFGWFRLKNLNRFRTPKWFLVFISIAACLKGLCIGGLTNVVVTTIERRFGLSSSQSGLIISSYDIASLIIILPVSYLGGKASASKPRWIACGMILLSIGNLFFALPHFITAPYTPHGSDADEDFPLCGSADDDVDCSEESGMSSLASYRFLFIFAQFLHGFGAAPLLTLGTTFLDQLVDPRSSSLYISAFQTWFIIGPAIGFILAGQLLSIHTDMVVESNLTPESSLWVGAWWPGFLITFVLSLLCGLCIFCYPQHLNPKKKTTTKSEALTSSIPDLLSAIWSLLRNPIHMLISLASGIDGLVITGLGAFLPKFMEQQFNLSSGTAAMLVGLIVVPAGGGGTFLSGWLIKKLNMSRHSIIMLCIMCQIINIPVMFSFFLSCSSSSYVGVNHQTPNITAQDSHTFDLSFVSSCNVDCSCSTSKFDPVCGSDSLMYLSPCLAGCSESLNGNNFTACACIAEGTGTAERTSCDSSCGVMWLFVVIQFIGIFLTFFAAMPSIFVILRCVSEDEKSLALGLQSNIIRLVGSIPGPIVFGYILDRTCLLWDSSCDGSGSCLLYDKYQMATSILTICMLGKLASLGFYILGWFASKKSSRPDVYVG